MTNKAFDVIAISESRILKDTHLSKNINIYNYSVVFTPTESHAGGTLLYINNKLSYKLRQDLCIYKSSELESTSIEIINPKKTNIIIGCIYRHPTMNVNEFNDNHLNILLQKISKEKKNVFLLGDFNVDLLKHDKHAGTNEFIDSFSSYMYLPYILHPTRVTSHSQTIIDNILSDYVSKEAMSGNLTSTISDHLPQVLFIPCMFSDNPATKSNIFERSWKNFNQAEFIMDYFDKDWSNILNFKHGNVNVSMENFVNNMNDLLDKHAPFKKISKYKLKFKTKPWITPALQKSISIKNALFKRYIKLKSPVKKKEVRQQYKYYRSLLSTLMKKSKQNYYEQFFKNKLNNLKNIWKGIRSLIAIKNSSAAKIFLHHPNEKSLFITPKDAHEVNLIICLLNSDKSTGPNSLPTKILKLLKK